MGKKEKYFKLSDAWNGVVDAVDKKEKAVAGLKLIGKTMFNVGIFTAKIGTEVIKQRQKETVNSAERELRTNKNLPNEKKEKYEEFISKYKE